MSSNNDTPFDVPDESRQKLRRAIGHRDRGELEQAMRLLSELSEEWVGWVGLAAEKGNVHWKLGELDAAIDEFKRATTLAPEWSVPSLALFVCLWDHGERVEALDEAKRFTLQTGSDEYMEIVREINQRSKPA